jgi:hypothetical protein
LNGRPVSPKIYTALALLALFSLLAGALVTSLKPQAVIGVSHAHRGLGAVALLLSFFVSRELGFTALAVSVLGAGLAWAGWPVFAAVAHAMLAHWWFGQSLLAWFHSRPAPPSARLVDEGSPSVSNILRWTPWLALVQMALGAAYRHSVMGFIPHIVGAIIVALAILYVASTLLSDFAASEVLKRSAWILIAITIVQLGLGLAAFLSRLEWKQSGNSKLLLFYATAHVLTGAMTYASLLLTGAQVQRHVRTA